MNCRTCLSLSGEKPILAQSRIYEGKLWVVEHAYPVKVLGWLVIILKRHSESLHQLTKEEFSELANIQEKFTKLLHKHLDSNKQYLACFAEGNNFHHIHLHLISKPTNLPESFKGPKIFELLGRDSLEKEIIISFCQKLKSELLA